MLNYIKLNLLINKKINLNDVFNVFSYFLEYLYNIIKMNLYFLIKLFNLLCNCL